MTKRKAGRPPKIKPDEYKHIPIYAAESKVLDDMIKIKCKSNVSSGDKVFIQDNLECMEIQRFRINSGFGIIEDPKNIMILIENLRGYEPYRFKIDDHIADLLILQTTP